MKIQDKIKDTFDKCAKIKFEGDSNDHPIIYLNILKNIIGDNKEKPSNTLMNKMIEISEEYLSIWSFCFFRGIPAVSVIKYFLSFASKFSSILSLVVPGKSETVDLSLFSKALNKVDFPAFGLPIIVKEVV